MHRVHALRDKHPEAPVPRAKTLAAADVEKQKQKMRVQLLQKEIESLPDSVFNIVPEPEREQPKTPTLKKKKPLPGVGSGDKRTSRGSSQSSPKSHRSRDQLRSLSTSPTSGMGFPTPSPRSNSVSPGSSPGSTRSHPSPPQTLRAVRVGASSPPKLPSPPIVVVPKAARTPLPLPSPKVPPTPASSQASSQGKSPSTSPGQTLRSPSMNLKERRRTRDGRNRMANPLTTASNVRRTVSTGTSIPAVDLDSVPPSSTSSGGSYQYNTVETGTRNRQPRLPTTTPPIRGKLREMRLSKSTPTANVTFQDDESSDADVDSV